MTRKKSATHSAAIPSTFKGGCKVIRPNGNKVNVSIIMTKEIKQFAAEEAEKLGLNLSSYIRMLLIREKQKNEKA